MNLLPLIAKSKRYIFKCTAISFVTLLLLTACGRPSVPLSQEQVVSESWDDVDELSSEEITLERLSDTMLEGSDAFNLVNEIPLDLSDENLPVYNLEIDPIESKTPLVLWPDVETQLTFYIGPNVQANVLGIGAQVNPDIKKLANGELLSINVTLNCLVCSGDTYQRYSLVYDPKTGRTEEDVKFLIRPDRSRVDSITGAGLLILSVDAMGIDLDIIHVPVFVGTPTHAQAAKWSPPVVRTIRHERIDTEDPPDLVIDIVDESNFLKVVLIPHLPELREAMKQWLNENVSPDSWTFRAGVSKVDLDDLVRKAYLELRGMIEQNETALQEVYARYDGAVDFSSGAARLDFDNKDLAAMLKPLRKHGARLYSRVFIRGEKQLRKAMRLLDEFKSPDKRSLRIQVRASNVYVPWQLLYPNPSGDIEPERFWGFRYDLGTRQLVDTVQASLPTTLLDWPNEARHVLFAAYRGSGASDDVAGRALTFSRYVAKKLRNGLKLADSRNKFLDGIVQHRTDLRLIIAYGHASSGSAILDVNGGRSLLVDQIAGVRFEFSIDDWIEPGDIDDLVSPSDDGLLLGAQPLVIFNACDTGAGGNRPMNNNGFVGALTRAGARAVIVTETPIWNSFAYHFGRDVFDRLENGDTARKALREARLHHLRLWNNPLGLTYSLYGNPAAQFVPD